LIQGGCGDVMKKVMVQIHALLKGTGIKMRLQVHDQLVFEGSREDLMQYCEKIRIIMHEAYPAKNGIVLTTDASFSETSFAERSMQKWT
jgi:DNA polymerase I-like protein with 3'-5' exonuclease and polymerase domains